MKELSRRAFVGSAVAVGASSALLTDAGRAQLVWTKSEWKLADFNAVLHVSKRIKQAFDASAINNGRFLNNIRNSLNGLHFGSGIPVDQIQLVCTMRGERQHDELR